VPYVFKQYSKTRANVVNYHRINDFSDEDFISRRRTSHDVDPEIIFDRFVKDYKNENENADFNK
jgi:hypothetical protein